MGSAKDLPRFEGEPKPQRTSADKLAMGLGAFILIVGTIVTAVAILQLLGVI